MSGVINFKFVSGCSEVVLAGDVKGGGACPMCGREVSEKIDWVTVDTPRWRDDRGYHVTIDICLRCHLWAKDCSECGGSAKESCGECGGEGFLSCGECNGWGNVDCEDCEDGTDECLHCDGTEECDECEDGRVDCATCKGNAEVPCGECEEGAYDCDKCDMDGDIPCGACFLGLHVREMGEVVVRWV